MSSFKLSRLDPANEAQLLAAISELELLSQIRCEESLTLLAVHLLLDGLYRSHGSAEQADSTFDRLISKLRKLDVTTAALLLHHIAEFEFLPGTLTFIESEQRKPRIVKVLKAKDPPKITVAQRREIQRASIPVLMNQAAWMQKAGKLDEAHYTLTRVFKLSEGMGEEETGEFDKKRMFGPCMRLAMLEADRKNTEAAVCWAEKALAAARETDTPSYWIGSIATFLASCYINLGRKSEIDSVVTSAVQSMDPENRANTYLAVARILFEADAAIDAQPQAEKAVEFFSTATHTGAFLRGEAWYYLGVSLHEQNRWAEALPNLENAAQFFHTEGESAEGWEMTTMQFMVYSLGQIGRIGDAIEVQKSMLKISARFNGEETYEHLSRVVELGNSHGVFSPYNCILYRRDPRLI